jgi:hypothetical protein
MNHLERNCEGLDAAVFSSDMMYDHERYSMFKEYLSRWNRAVEEHDKAEMTATTPPAAQPALVQQEPVYHLRQYGDVTKEQFERYAQTGSIAPPSAQRTWVGLTKADINEIWKGEPMLLPWDMTRTLAIEQRLKEKNNG